jgi:hypothetical protein
MPARAVGVVAAPSSANRCPRWWRACSAEQPRAAMTCRLAGLRFDLSFAGWLAVRGLQWRWR